MLKFAAQEIVDQAEPEEPSQLRRALPWLVGIAGAAGAGYLASRYLGGPKVPDGGGLYRTLGMGRTALEGTQNLATLGGGPGNAVSHGVMIGAATGAGRALTDHLHARQDTPDKLSLERVRDLVGQKDVPGGKPGMLGRAFGMTDPTNIRQVSDHATAATQHLNANFPKDTPLYQNSDSMLADAARRYKTVGEFQKALRVGPGLDPNLGSAADSQDTLTRNVRMNRLDIPGRLGRIGGAAAAGAGLGLGTSYLSDMARSVGGNPPSDHQAPHQ
jgi:hypothetical protein